MQGSCRCHRRLAGRAVVYAGISWTETPIARIRTHRQSVVVVGAGSPVPRTHRALDRTGAVAGDSILPEGAALERG